ncbi:MAG: hypothetical protein JW747_10675 [Candidatus Aminicenantes bacterium]|nr:hypothetical protein [Candidatus Aminicenantes bacterium]
MSEELKNGRDQTGRFVKGNVEGLRHGLFAYRMKGKIPVSIRGKRRIQRHLTSLRSALVESVPGSDDPWKQVLIGQVVTVEGLLALIQEILKKAGIIHPGKWLRGVAEFQPVVLEISRLLTCQRQALSALGLDSKRTDDVLDLKAYVAQKDAEKDLIAAKENGGNEEKGE